MSSKMNYSVDCKCKFKLQCLIFIFSGLNDAAIGGAVGGAVFFIIIISLVLLVLLYVKCLRKRNIINVKSPFSTLNRGNYCIAQNVVGCKIIILVHLEGKTLANLVGPPLHFNTLMIVGRANSQTVAKFANAFATKIYTIFYSKFDFVGNNLLTT